MHNLHPGANLHPGCKFALHFARWSKFGGANLPPGANLNPGANCAHESNLSSPKYNLISDFVLNDPSFLDDPV